RARGEDLVEALHEAYVGGRVRREIDAEESAAALAARAHETKQRVPPEGGGGDVERTRRRRPLALERGEDGVGEDVRVEIDDDVRRESNELVRDALRLVVERGRGGGEDALPIRIAPLRHRLAVERERRDERVAEAERRQRVRSHEGHAHLGRPRERSD